MSGATSAGPRSMNKSDPLPVFYINLDSRPDRCAFMLHQFDSLGIDAIRVPGRVGVAANGLSAAQIGASSSHAAVWELICAGSAPAGVVFEDDAVLSPRISDLLRDPALQSDWYDVLRLETRMFPLRLGRPSAEPMAPPFTARRQLSPLAGSTGYVISRKAAAELRRSPELWDRPIDVYMFGIPRILDMKMMQIAPAPVVSLELYDPTRSEARSDAVGTFELPPSAGWGRRWRRRLSAVVRYPVVDTVFGMRASDVPFCGDT